MPCLRAGDHGLAPELFHANLLRSPATLPPLDRELLLSDAFLSYADALARGVMPVERRRDDETLTPEPIDVAAALDAAIGSPDPAAAIEALAPTTPTYRLLRPALQNFRAGGSAGGKTATSRLREIEVNLERERWLPRRLPADRVWVNVADERLVLYRDDRPVFSTRVIVGQDDRRNQSPEFQATIDGIWFNPPWNVPEDIATNEILPKAAQRPELFGAAQHGHAARWRAAAAGGTQLSARAIDVRDEQPVRRLPARYPVERSVQPRRPPHQSWMHQGGESTGAGRSADAATDRCNQSSDRDGQHHPKQSATSPCRYSWCTRPRSRMSMAGCNFARMYTDATPRSGRT